MIMLSFLNGPLDGLSCPSHRYPSDDEQVRMRLEGSETIAIYVWDGRAFRFVKCYRAARVEDAECTMEKHFKPNH